MSNQDRKLFVSKKGVGFIGAQRGIEFEQGTGATVEVVDAGGKIRVKISADAGATPPHSGLTNLAWPVSGHTGGQTSVAAWDAGGTPQVVPATVDEVMLVRRGGALQWIPLIIPLTFTVFDAYHGNFTYDSVTAPGQATVITGGGWA